MKLHYKDCGKIGFTCSTFDLLHAGHITMLEEAKRHCDRFVVFLQKDPSLTRFTKYKPVMSCYERYKNLMSIKYIDEVYMYQTEEELLELIKFIDPDVRVLGEDYIDNPFTGDDLDIEVIYTTRSHEWSTTKLKNRIAAMTIIQNPEILNAIKIKEIKAGDFSSIEN